MKIKNLIVSSFIVCLSSLCTNTFAVKTIKKMKGKTEAKTSEIKIKKKINCACCDSKHYMTEANKIFSSCKLGHVPRYLCSNCSNNIKNREPQILNDFLNCKLCTMYENINHDSQTEKDLLLYLEHMFNSRIFQSSKYLFFNVLKEHDARYNKNFSKLLIENNPYYFGNLGDIIYGFDDNNLEKKYLYDQGRIGTCFICFNVKNVNRNKFCIGKHSDRLCSDCLDKIIKGRNNCPICKRHMSYEIVDFRLNE